jgi:hypothetical protein
VHYLSSPCTSIHSSALIQCIHPPCVHPVHLDPSIAPLYLLRYSTADLPFVVDIQGKPTIVHVGHYSQPTVTDALSITRTEFGSGHLFMHGRRSWTKRRKSAPVTAFSRTSRWMKPSMEMAGRMEYLAPQNWNSYWQARLPCFDHAYGLLTVNRLKWLSSAKTSCSGRS